MSEAKVPAEPGPVVAESKEARPAGPDHVVALGASAGGLDALERFFREAPVDANLAYVVIVHLSPDFKSLMQELLAKHTTMPVTVAVDGVRLERDRVYVIPPAKNITVSEGRLRLAEQHRGSSGINLPIDIFFESASDSYQDRVIAVILSGTGTDGTRGMRAVKGHGGVSLVQDPESAKFDGMPRSVIDAGLADYVLRPEDIARRIDRIARHPSPRVSVPDTDEETPAAPDLSRVLKTVRQVCGIDLSYYKRTTLARRLERRMKLRSTDTVDDYQQLMERDSAEVEALKQDLLIGVTRFFRDREVFDVLEQVAIPPMMAQQGSEELRVWVPACSTGEEVYSIAISLATAFERKNQPLRMKIFGTDVDVQAIEFASRGVYPSSIAADIPQDRLARYFISTGNGYQITQAIRERVIFAPHNLVKDAPLTRMDLVSCRNFLIYLEPNLQREVLACLHFALKPRAVMILGSAETVGEMAEDFDVLDKRWRLYRKQRNAPLPELRRRSPLADYTGRRSVSTSGTASHVDNAVSQAMDLYAELRQSVCLLVGMDRRLLRVFGDAQGILIPPRGDISHDVMQVTAPPLRIPLTTALHRIAKGETHVAYGDIELNGSEQSRRVNVEVRRLSRPAGQDEMTLVVVEPSRQRIEPRRDPASFDSNSQQQIADLEGELQRTKENLQATIEELATTNEEQQATNEELTASNEELQSTNEELQSVNEELFTVNGEYQAKIQELTDLTNDTENLLRATEIGTIYLDAELRIRKFTPAVTRVLELIPADVGRPLSGFSEKLDASTLVEDARAALDGGQGVAKEVRHAHEDVWFLKRVQPYRTETGAIDGVVVTFVEITPLKHAQRALAQQKELLEAVANNIPILLIYYDRDGQVHWINRCAERVLGWTRDELKDVDLLASCFPDPEPRELLLEGGGAAGSWRDVKVCRRDGSTLDLSWTCVMLSEGMHIGVGQDVTDRRRDERRQSMMVRELDHRVKNNLNTVLAVARETARATSDVDQFTRAFEGRVRSMAIAHEMLAGTRWEGADLGEMARRVLEPYAQADNENRVRLDGVQVKLDRHSAPTLCMVLHELATNAAKYGALSVPEGQVALSWALESPDDGAMRLRVEWCESGGPSVVAPNEPGYGTQFVTEAVEYSLDGQANLQFEEGGVRCVVTLPYRRAANPSRDDRWGDEDWPRKRE